MRKLLAVLAVVAFAAIAAQADNSVADKPDQPKPDAGKPDSPQPATMNFHSYGGSAREAVESFATLLKYKAAFDPAFNPDTACWMHLVAAEPETVRVALEHAVLGSIVVDDARKTVSAYHSFSSVTHGNARVYDVSAQCARYVDYVNKYAPKARVAVPVAALPGAVAAPAQPAKARCAADHLLATLGEVVLNGSGAPIGSAVVGDRIVYRAGNSTDAHIREFLGQLVSEEPGVPLSASRAMEAHGKLEKVVSVTAEDTPAASVLMEIARKCEVSIVITPDMGQTLGGEHISITSEKDETARSIMQRMAPQVTFIARYTAGFLSVEEVATARAPECYFIFETESMLERLAKAYDRQRTASGREGGYDGSLRDEGGIDVIVNALNEYFTSDADSFSATSFGSRLIVTGGPAARKTAVEVLKGLGWEDPAASPEDPNGR